MINSKMKKKLLIPAFLLTFSLFAQPTEAVEQIGLDNEEDLSVDPLFQLDMPSDGVSELEQSEVPENNPYSEENSNDDNNSEENFNVNNEESNNAEINNDDNSPEEKKS